jgi:NADPH-dependent 2,4-dienoyl-CoA reductase/sulfur reductase-like enzyme
MSRECLLVIGGVAAGMSAASRARKINPRLEIIVLEKGPFVSYGTCGLPYYVAGRVRRPEELIVYTPEFFRRERNIDVRTGHEAVEILRGQKRVRALRRGSDEIVFGYDKLVICTGAAPARIAQAAEIPGSDAENVFTCNDLAGATALRQFIEKQRPRRAAVVGAGYIGLEVAEALLEQGMEVTVLERAESVLESIEPELSQRVEMRLEDVGVRLLKTTTVRAIAGSDVAPGRATTVEYGTSGSLDCDLVLLATGIVPRTELAREAGIRLGQTGAIAVDDRMATNISGIYAAGDCVETQHLVLGRPVYVPLGTTANKQGRIAGENAAGGNARFAGIVGTAVTKVFGLEVARTGISVAEARAAGFACESVVVEHVSRASYFEGKPLLLKMVFDRNSERLLGVQMLGEEGAGKRIDVAATALHARMKVSEVAQLDLSYAPPVAPVWEALLIAAQEAVKKLRR